MSKIKSYTTRPPRKDDENDIDNHIFINKEKFDELQNLVAYTNYNGYEYCATVEQVDVNNFYIIDPNGVKYFKSVYKGRKTPVIIYVDTDYDVRKKRMKHRGDSETVISKRLKFDETAFSIEALKDIGIDIVIDNNANLDETKWGESIVESYGSSTLRWFAE